MGMIAYENGEETVHKMQTLFIILLFQKLKKSINKVLHKIFGRRSSCPTCNHLRHLAGAVRGRVYIALKNDQEMSSKEYLGYNIETFKKHIEQQFTEVMS